MDHLKTPSQVSHSLEFPFYGQFYDGLGLEGFPARRHYGPDSWLSRSPGDVGDRVSCKGAIAYLENLLESMYESVRQSYGQKIRYYIALLNSMYDIMCHDAKCVRDSDAKNSLGRLSGLVDQLDPAQCLRFKTWSDSWFYTCRAGQAEEKFSIKDAAAWLVDAQIRMYEGEEEPNVETCRKTFDQFQGYIRTFYKIAMLTPDNLTFEMKYGYKFAQSLKNIRYRPRTPPNRWYHTRIDMSIMIVFCLEGDFDGLPGDTYYDGLDPQEHLNWTADFAVFDAKQRRDREIVQSTTAAIAILDKKDGVDSNGIKYVSDSQKIEGSTES